MAENTTTLVTLDNLSDHTDEIKSILQQVRAYIDKQDSAKVDKVTGKQLSMNDYTTAEKTKLSSIEKGAQKNTVTGVKGNAEASYRTGNINITPADIGAATTAVATTSSDGLMSSTDKQNLTDTVNTMNVLIDRWVQTNLTAGMSRIDGDPDPAAETLYGAAQVREIGKHLRLKVIKNGEVIKTAAAGRLTLATNGEDIAIDGSEGDVMLGFDCDTYLLKASEEIDSVKHNMMGVSLAPASWQGHTSKKFRPWAITPCETVHAQIFDDVRPQAHCIYNTSVTGTYSTPVALFAEKLYTGGGGLRTVGISGISVIQAAQAKNADAATCFPYMPSYYEFEEFMRVMMYSECGTKNTTAKDIFGVGCTPADPTSSTTFYDTAMSADSGIKIITTGGTESYMSIWGLLKVNSSDKATLVTRGINSSVYNFIPNLEEQRLLDGIAKAGLVSYIGNYQAIFSYDDSGNVVVVTDGSVNPSTGAGMTAGKRYYVVRSVPNCEGMADGVMTAVINCYVKLTCNSGVCDASGNDISGASAIFKFSLGIYRGWSIPLRGTFRFISGMAYTIRNEGGTYKNSFYCCERPEDMQPLTNTTIYGPIGTKFNALKGMHKFITEGLVCSSFWAKSADYNLSLFCYLTHGGRMHTHECAFIHRDNCIGGAPGDGRLAEGYECVNASLSGCDAGNYNTSTSTLQSNLALSNVNIILSGAFAAYPIVEQSE